MDDSLLTINGYNIFRKDRVDGRGGGVCVYLNDEISSQRWLDLERPDLECLWLTLRPRRLPRTLSGIAICVVYHPPGLPVESHKNLSEYLITTTDYLRNKHPDHGLVFLGDFNDFDIKNLVCNHSLKQIVEQPTRNSAILDLIITNMHSLYTNPSILAPLGSSDHNIVHWQPRLVNKQSSQIKPIKRQVRRYPQSGMDALGRWLSTHNWFGDLDPNASVDNMTASFTTQLTDAIDRIFPVKSIKMHKTDKPWMTPKIKLLINDRQRAFHSGNNEAWRSLKYKVQQVITNKKRSYYKNKVQHLKKEDCRKWWSAINQMSGRTVSASEFVLKKDGNTIRGKELANSLNNYYISVNADIPPLNMNTLPAFLPASEDTITIQPYEVCNRLLAVKPAKAHGPDNIPCRIVKEFAYELAEPVTTIFNKSLQSGTVPALWKESNIIPIPKVPSPNEESDTRPISLTPCLSKILEDFVVKWLLDDIRDKIDQNQFGCLKGTSTTFCLLDMIHTWLCFLDHPGRHLRLCFLDFSKAFDRIGYNVLVERLLVLGVRRCLLPWIINFLTDRQQRVKLSTSTSNWLPVTAGVPQGTKLGPILFLVMINSLSISSPESCMWKYVDDVSLSEGLMKNTVSNIQSSLDAIATWSTNSWMKLNAKKCKEMRISFLKQNTTLSSLMVDDQQLELVTSHKVLGLIIQNNLKWNEHIDATVLKASKRLHILRVLRRGGVDGQDLVTIYISLIRSVLEYCCAVWHHAIPAYLSENLERVQKRALRIIAPSLSYSEALSFLQLPRLDTRRNDLCSKTIKNISRGGALSKHLPSKREDIHNYQTRGAKNFTLFKCRTQRLRRSFFPSTIVAANNKTI